MKTHFDHLPKERDKIVFVIHHEVYAASNVNIIVVIGRIRKTKWRKGEPLVELDLPTVVEVIIQETKIGQFENFSKNNYSINEDIPFFIPLMKILHSLFH